MTENETEPGRYLAISGGVGGAKLALGLSRVLSAEQLTVVANTGDDFEHLGLKICPDLDTVMYTLAGLSDRGKGWGLEGESWQALDAIRRLKGPSWFQLGDMDLGTHLTRTELLRSGLSLSEVTAHLTNCLGVRHQLFPMSDQSVETQVLVNSGDYLSFQHYFVRDACKPEVRGFRFEGIDTAGPSPGFAAILQESNLGGIILCPSNPFVSIDPVLNLQGVRQMFSGHRVVAVSPIVGGQALKGPAAKMMDELNMPRNALSVAKHYVGLLDGFVLDQQDQQFASAIEDLGMAVRIAQTVMVSLQDRIDLAEDILAFMHSMGER